MAASHKSKKEKISFRIKPSTLYRILKKWYIFKNSLFLYNKKFESKKTLSFSFINKNKKEIIIEIKNKEKEMCFTHLILKFGHFCIFWHTKKGKQDYAYFKLNKDKLFQLLKFKMSGTIQIKSIRLYSRNSSKNYKYHEKKYIGLGEDKNKSLNTKETTRITFSKANKIIDFAFAKKNYCNYYPDKNDMKDKADKKICHFPIECFHDVNYEHNRIGNKDYLILKKSSFYNSNNDSYKKIDIKDHIFLNHLCHKNINNTIINASTIRYRHKNVTFVYYK